MSKAEVELPRLCASRDTLAPVLVRFTLCFPVDWNKKAKAESARPDAGGYHRRKVVSKCALNEKGFPFEGKLSPQVTDEVDTQKATAFADDSFRLR